MARPMVLCVALAAAPIAAVGAAGGAQAAAVVTVPVDVADGPQPRPGPALSASGSCPDAETIWAAMATLVPRGALGALPRAGTIDIADLGETYRVRLLTEGGVERVRVYRDRARDCEQRARFAAVFVVLTLMPPELLIDSPVARQPPPELIAPPAPPVIQVAEPPPRLLRLELAALGDTAPAVMSAPGVSSPGVELRLAIGRGALAGVLGIGLEAPSEFTLGTLRAREQRVPVDAGVRLRRLGRWLEIGGELGLTAVRFHAEGLSPVIARQASGLDIGARAGVTVRLGARAARLAPIAGLHGAYFPRPYELAMQPAGVVGKTPSFRVGATLGIAASF